MARHLRTFAFIAWGLVVAAMLAACGPGGTEKAAQHIEKGNRLVAESKYEEAIAEFKKAAELNRDSVEPYMLIGNVYRALKKYDDAFDAYREAKKVDRYKVRPHIESALARMELGQIEHAINELNHVVELEPRNLQALVLLGRASMTPRPLPDGTTGVPKASLDRAQLNLEAASQVAPDDIEAYYWLAKLYEKVEKKDKALAAWTKVRQLAGNKPEHDKIATEIAEALARLKK